MGMYTEGHALAFLKYVIQPLLTLINCDGEISGLGVNNLIYHVSTTR